MFIWFENANSVDNTIMTLIPSQYFKKKIPIVFEDGDSIKTTFLSSGAVQQRPVSASFSIQPEVPLFSYHICLEKKSS